MKTLRSLSLALCSPLALCATALLGCGQDPPPDPVTLKPYHPLVDGSWWESRHSDWTERVTLAATTLGGAPAFLMTDSPNPSADVRADATVVAEGGRVLRKA